MQSPNEDILKEMQEAEEKHDALQAEVDEFIVADFSLLEDIANEAKWTMDDVAGMQENV